MRTLALSLALLLLSCSAPSKPDCDDLAHRCHAAAENPNATAMQKECHEKAHDEWSNAECLTRKAGCEAVCPDHGHDGG